MKKIWGTTDPFFETGDVMGRKVANHGFITHLLQADPFDAYHFFLPDGKSVESVRGQVEKLNKDMVRDQRVCFFRRRDIATALTKNRYHSFHLSDCINYPAHLARLRNAYSPDIFPVTATTHSLSYHNYPSSFLSHLWPGITSRDCVVATTPTARRVVESLYATLEKGYGQEKRLCCRPAVEVIPLGVDDHRLKPPTPEQRAEARESFPIQPEQVVLLAFGRISPHSKMDILPLYRALQRILLNKKTRKKFKLILAGWTDVGDDMDRTLMELAVNMGLDVTVVPRPDERQKVSLFRASDIFVSPADNPQETFGLSILEAGAFGLPVVASDYDGYRSLITHGKNGFLIPTLGCRDTWDIDMLAPLCGDSHSHLLLAQQTVISVPDLATMLETLISDSGMRMEMGRNGREMVESVYSWPKVITDHLDLWDDLWVRPVDRNGLDTINHPLHVKYGEVFRHYTSDLLDETQCLVWTRTGQAVYRQQEFPLTYAGLEDHVDPKLIARLVFHFRKPAPIVRVKEVLAESTGLDSRRAAFMIAWALKQDLLELVQ